MKLIPSVNSQLGEVKCSGINSENCQGDEMPSQEHSERKPGLSPRSPKSLEIGPAAVNGAPWARLQLDLTPAVLFRHHRSPASDAGLIFQASVIKMVTLPGSKRAFAGH